MANTTSATGPNRIDYGILAAQVVLGVVLVLAWEWTGRTFGDTWTSLPTLIGVRLVEWGGSVLPRHIAVTLMEIGVGMLIGATSGVAVGLLLGQSILFGTIFRPIVVAFYSVPIVTLAPLVILWFGLEMAPKIALVAVSSFFLLFFNTFSGVKAIDRDLFQSLRLMGSTGAEEFRKVSIPGAMSWIVSGVKIAVPYSIAAAVTGELLAAREGIGSLISTAAAQFDMTGLYAALVVLMVIGIIASAAMVAAERYLLRWRDGGK